MICCYLVIIFRLKVRFPCDFSQADYKWSRWTTKREVYNHCEGKNERLKCTSRKACSTFVFNRLRKWTIFLRHLQSANESQSGADELEKQFPFYTHRRSHSRFTSSLIIEQTLDRALRRKSKCQEQKCVFEPLSDTCTTHKTVLLFHVNCLLALSCVCKCVREYFQR